ncbi:MAG: RluA family pseudouridine synthase [Mycoplasmataceae bacterium]|nr:RluA family pseudouridine synthase [Mycoplasmataceae bacterium]
MLLNKEIELKSTEKIRIDKFISDNSDFSRNEIKEIIDTYGVFVDGILVRKVKFMVNEGQTVVIKEKIQKEIDMIAQNIEIEVAYEDDHIIIINKKSGMVVHPAPGNKDGTLVNALLYHFKDLSDLNGVIRPGIVHRIDKHTSGLILIAKNNTSHKYFAQLIKEHKVNRFYKALVIGKMLNNVIHINVPIGRNINDRQKMTVTKLNSKEAITHVFPEKVYKNYTLVRCELETGRTHQIRVHLKYVNFPIVGDPTYGRTLDDFNQRLHAYKLSFIHITGEFLEIESELPKEFFQNIDLDL